MLGWLIVAISYGVAAYNIGRALVPAIELSEFAFSLSGLSLVLLMLMVWGWGSRLSAAVSRHRTGRPLLAGYQALNAKYVQEVSGVALNRAITSARLRIPW